MSGNSHASPIIRGRIAPGISSTNWAGGFRPALGGILAEAGEIPGALMGPHHPARAKSVIFLFMCGGVSHIDTLIPRTTNGRGPSLTRSGSGTTRRR